jgi:hypothetical protein
MKIVVFWVVATCSLVEVYQRFRGPCSLHLPAPRASETLLNFYQTTGRYNPEDSHLHHKPVCETYDTEGMHRQNPTNLSTQLWYSHTCIPSRTQTLHYSATIMSLSLTLEAQDQF